MSAATSRKNGSGKSVNISDASLDHQGAAAREARFDPEKPYSVEVEVEGVAAILCHRYDTADVEAKGAAGKGSSAKKTDNLESYVYRDPDSGECGIPAVAIKACLAEAAKNFQDPRSKRKSARDLVKASIFVTPEVASLGKKMWDYEDRQSAVVNMSRITRVRPAFRKGWRIAFQVNVLQPTLIPKDVLESMLKTAGSFCGLLDQRPDYGRFTIRKFEVRPYIE